MTEIQSISSLLYFLIADIGDLNFYVEREYLYLIRECIIEYWDKL